MQSPQAKYMICSTVAVSSIEIPELLPTPPEASSHLAIDLGQVAETGLPNGTALGPFCQIDQEKQIFWLNIPDVARYQVERGERIIVEALPGAKAASIRAFLLGSCLAALFFQRGFLVLRGSAVRLGEGCLVCAGHSGTGKSTLAAYFLQHGCQVIADDMIVIDAKGFAHPGIPRLRIWKDAAEKLGINTATLEPVQPHLQRFSSPLGGNFCTNAMPVRWIYTLQEHNKQGWELEIVRGMRKIETLRAITYRVRFMDHMALEADYLRLCGVLAGSTHITHLRRATHGVAPSDLAAFILEDATTHTEKS